MRETLKNLGRWKYEYQNNLQTRLGDYLLELGLMNISPYCHNKSQKRRGPQFKLAFDNHRLSFRLLPSFHFLLSSFLFLCTCQSGNTAVVPAGPDDPNLTGPDSSSICLQPYLHFQLDGCHGHLVCTKNHPKIQVFCPPCQRQKPFSVTSNRIIGTILIRVRHTPTRTNIQVLMRTSSTLSIQHGSRQGRESRSPSGSPSQNPPTSL